jgi:CO dehydrogenase nickel-insertion accessory protein CooC1
MPLYFDPDGTARTAFELLKRGRADEGCGRRCEDCACPGAAMMRRQLIQLSAEEQALIDLAAEHRAGVEAEMRLGRRLDQIAALMTACEARNA